jgi:ABC-type microcin C transport system permease subunit YejB
VLRLIKEKLPVSMSPGSDDAPTYLISIPLGIRRP